MKSTLQSSDLAHVAIIPDGNGRWAERRGLPRSAGHEAGSRAVRRLIEAAASRGIAVLTLFAFSADNWSRPPEEVKALMTLFERYLHRRVESCRRQGVRIDVIGRRDRVGRRLRGAIARAERRTRSGDRLLLRVAIDYSGKQSIELAARTLVRSARTAGPTLAFEDALADACHSIRGVPPVDLLIRTSGEMRLSDFLLWETAHAELVFTPVLWPDFGPADLDAALASYRGRERRFGAVSSRPAAAALQWL